MNSYAIVVENLGYRYGQLEAVKGIGFKVAEGKKNGTGRKRARK